MNGGIYIHIPYCRKACHYCNFHFSTNLSTIRPLVKVIAEEISAKGSKEILTSIDTIYFGGGTPSILSLDLLSVIMRAIKASFQISPDVEITLEANPEDITDHQLQGWYDLGINRLSIGIQSFWEKDLIRMNRAHTSAQSYEALKLVKESAFTNITADLMFGLVDSTSDDWRENLEKMISFDLPHLSIYNLTIEEQTVYAHQAKKQVLSLPSDDHQNQQYLLAEELLAEHGYEHYEISNYAKPGHRATHNAAYWDRKPYIGIGPSAHSFYNNHRYWNPAHNQAYLSLDHKNQADMRCEVLSKMDIYNELIMLGLRRSDGVEESMIKSLGSSIWKKYVELSNPLIRSGVISRQHDRLVLDKGRWYMSDDISSSLFLTSLPN